MRVAGRENVWAIGDAAAVPDPAKRRQAPEPADRPARAPPGTAGGRQRGRRARAARKPQAVPLPHARRVRGHGPAQGGRHDARRAPARLPGLVRGAHLPPGDDAGRGAPGCAWRSTGPSACSSAAPRPSSGQLGHPAVARATVEERGERSPVSGELLVPRGTRRRPARHLRARRGRPATPSRKERGLLPRGTSAPRTTWTTRWQRERAAARVHRRPARRLLLGLRGRATRWSATRAIARFGADGRADRAVGRARRTPARASGGRCWSAAGPSRPTPELGRVVVGIGTPRRPDPLHRVRRDARERATGTCATAAEEYLERRSQEIDATEPRRARAHRRARRGRVEAPRAARDRARAPAAARVLRPHPHLPRHDRRRARRGDRRSAG